MGSPASNGNGSIGTSSPSALKPSNFKMEVDIKRYAKVEKIPGGEISDSHVLKGVMFNKDTTHSKMRRRIENPRVLLLDCPLEYKKGESQTCRGSVGRRTRNAGIAILLPSSTDSTVP